MRSFFFFFIFCTQMAATGQLYNTALIPDSLLQNADAVLRVHDIHITVHSIGSATIRTRYAYTILNERGNAFAQFYTSSDGFEKLQEASGKLFNAVGKQIKYVKKKEMLDEAYNDGFSLVSDSRITKHNFYSKEYPYTIEYEEQIYYNGLYEFPTWQPMDSYNCSIQNSSCTIEMPLDYKLRYKLLNGAPEAIITVKDKVKKMSWQVVGLKAVEYEIMQPQLNTVMPSVLLGPDDFEYGGYKGNLGSWENYGKYYAALYKGRDVLPVSIQTQVHTLTDNLQTTSDKIKVLYHFLQQNTRYISIQLGIGGLQPFDATFVAEKKYGDCKALSNYMVSMLKEAAYPAIIYGGKNFLNVYNDFPKHYFNHVVACVPLDKDTMWLECTSQAQSAGYAGSFTGNRKALLITEQGGKLVNTPHYTINDNVQIRKITANIDEEGNLIAESFTKTTGITQETQHSLLYDANAEQREEYLNQTLNLPTYKVEQSSYKELKGIVPAMEELLRISSPNYASVTGKRLFIQPNLFNKESKLPDYKNRRFDIELKDACRFVDSVFITLPAGYSVESFPQNVNLENKFGNYKIAFVVKNNVIEMIRVREKMEATFPPSDYTALVEYYDAIAKADRSKIVMVKN
jgi:hypothetical protein